MDIDNEYITNRILPIYINYNEVLKLENIISKENISKMRNDFLEEQKKNNDLFQ